MFVACQSACTQRDTAQPRQSDDAHVANAAIHAVAALEDHWKPPGMRARTQVTLRSPATAHASTGAFRVRTRRCKRCMHAPASRTHSLVAAERRASLPSSRSFGVCRSHARRFECTSASLFAVACAVSATRRHLLHRLMRLAPKCHCKLQWHGEKGLQCHSKC